LKHLKPVIVLIVICSSILVFFVGTSYFYGIEEKNAQKDISDSCLEMKLIGFLNEHYRLSSSYPVEADLYEGFSAYGYPNNLGCGQLTSEPHMDRLVSDSRSKALIYIYNSPHQVEFYFMGTSSKRYVLDKGAQK